MKTAQRSGARLALAEAISVFKSQKAEMCRAREGVRGASRQA